MHIISAAGGQDERASRFSRHKTLFKGRIYFNARLSSMDCIVRDVTANGARLEFSENVTPPEVFELYLGTRTNIFVPG